jgi:cation transport protein ChaC
MLRQWNGIDPIWIFAYGSLIWRPEFDYDDKTCGIVYGFHRSLCLWSTMYRGTPEYPGLVLGLEHGGCCRGVVFRIPGDCVVKELRALWRREMVTGSYIPRWVDVRANRHGHITRLKAISFIMDRQAKGYAGELSHDALVNIVRKAKGERGTCAEYVLATVKCLDEHGIHDRHLTALANDIGLSLFDPTRLAI